MREDGSSGDLDAGADRSGATEDGASQEQTPWSAPKLIRRPAGVLPQGGPNVLTPDNPTETGTLS